MIRQIDNPSPGAVTGGNKYLALTREVNLNTLSYGNSEDEIRDSGSPDPYLKILLEVNLNFKERGLLQKNPTYGPRLGFREVIPVPDSLGEEAILYTVQSGNIAHLRSFNTA